MSGHINDIVPLIRKHFDFLVTDWGYECVRTWSEFMSRYQGAEYQSARATVFVEQADSPILDVRIMDGQAHRGFSLGLEVIFRFFLLLCSQSNRGKAEGKKRGWRVTQGGGLGGLALGYYLAAPTGRRKGERTAYTGRGGRGVFPFRRLLAPRQ